MWCLNNMFWLYLRFKLLKYCFLFIEVGEDIYSFCFNTVWDSLYGSVEGSAVSHHLIC